ncbi:MAG: hypothetical protein U5L45_15030 [Saprospiraceae bacterium]|nr:hypothetical protein [Saprospiraceae bacterium]
MGYRIDAKKFYIDITLGADLAYHYNVKATEKGTATVIGGASYPISGEVKTTQYDIRPRGQVGISMNRMGIFGGYSYGLTNYTPDPFQDRSNFSRLIRFGLTYQINGKSL